MSPGPYWSWMAAGRRGSGSKAGLIVAELLHSTGKALRLYCGVTILPETEGRKLKLFQAADPLKHWWSLGEMRFCAKCEHLFTGHDIRVTIGPDEQLEFHCPTPDCPGHWEDWQYPNLHL
jgi:hypothetical protein